MDWQWNQKCKKYIQLDKWKNDKKDKKLTEWKYKNTIK